jgi:hypothetical protein
MKWSNEMREIGKFCLKNNGGFVCKLQFVYWDENGEKHHVDGGGNITLGFSDTQDPGAHGIPDGANVALYVFVVWGSDNEAPQMFTYRSGSASTANYSISGTTLSNSLGLVSVS